MKTYLRHRIHNVVDVKELIALEYLDFEGEYKEYKEKHDFWEICYVEKGEITLFSGTKKYSLAENQLAVISPGKMHSYHSEKGNENRVFVICFESFSSTLKTLSERVMCLDSAQTFFVNTIKSECERTFRMNESGQLEVLSRAVFGGQQALISQLEYLLITLVRHLSLDRAEIEFLKDERFYEDLTDAIVRYLRENVAKKLTLNDICKRFNYSRSFICKTFKEQTKETLVSYFNTLKMEEAKRLLKDTNATVTEISTSLGYSEVQYFNLLFKKHEGVSPLLYRKQVKNS